MGPAGHDSQQGIPGSTAHPSGQGATFWECAASARWACQRVSPQLAEQPRPGSTAKHSTPGKREPADEGLVASVSPAQLACDSERLLIAEQR